MSHSIDITGGQAEFYDTDELTVRQERTVEELMLQLGDLMQRLANASVVSGAADGEALPGLTGPPVVISNVQAEQLARLGDEVTFMYLKSWTLQDLVFPSKASDLLALKRGIYSEISQHAAKLFSNKNAGGGFELSDSTIADTDSPTGVSDGLATL